MPAGDEFQRLTDNFIFKILLPFAFTTSLSEGIPNLG